MMINNIKTRLRNQYWLLAIVATVFLTMLFVDNHSYLHDLNSKGDTALFLFCGRAWMNGLVPYVDFSDSKGPLLWLVYGIGYLFSPKDYVGVFWLYVLSYVLTFFVNYQSMRLMLGDKRKSTVATLLMTPVYFNLFIHNEFRAEDLTQLFFALSLYSVLKLYYCKERKETVLPNFLIGLSLGATLLIKYNVTAMLVCFAIWALIISCRKSYSFVYNLLYMAAGGLIVLIPFVLYFVANGCLSAFINEYFILTLMTVGNTTQLTGIAGLLNKAGAINLDVYLFLIAICVLLGCMKFRKDSTLRLMIPTCSLWVLIVTYQNSWNYYFNNLSIFAVPAMAFMVDKVELLSQKAFAIATIVLAVILTIVPDVMLIPTIRDSFFLTHSQEKNAFSQLSSILAKHPKSKILYYQAFRFGLDVQGGSLPACKYFLSQTGQTKEMSINQGKAIQQRTPDFIITGLNDDSERLTLITKNHYKKISEVNYLGVVLYSKWHQ